MAAQLEEVIFHPLPPSPPALPATDSRHNSSTAVRFYRPLSSLALLCRFRLRQRPPVHLPVRRQRQLLQPTQTLPAPCTPAIAPSILPQLSLFYRSLPTASHHIAHQPSLFTHHHHHSRPLHDSQRRLDLAQLDPVPAHLHLLVHPSQKLDSPSASTAQISSPVQPRSRLTTELVRINFSAVNSGRPSSLVPILLHRVQSPLLPPPPALLLIQHVFLRVAQRPPDRNLTSLIFNSYSSLRPDSCLRWPIKVHTALAPAPSSLLTATGNASPPQITISHLYSRLPPRLSCPSADGVSTRTLTCFLHSNRYQLLRLIASLLAGTITSRTATAQSNAQISHTEKSKA